MLAELANRPAENDEGDTTPHFTRGDIVKVKRYGRGIVEEANALQVTVAFSDGIRRCFDPGFVEATRPQRIASAKPGMEKAAA